MVYYNIYSYLFYIWRTFLLQLSANRKINRNYNDFKMLNKRIFGIAKKPLHYRNGEVPLHAGKPESLRHGHCLRDMYVFLHAVMIFAYELR